MAVGILLFPGKAMADEGGCAVSIPVSVALENAADAAETEFQVAMTAETAETPMPAEDTLIFTGEGTKEFGPITYTVPGDYHYTVSQVKGTEKSCVYDEAAYALTVRVVNAEEGGLAAEVWAVKDGQTDKTDSIRFENTWILPTATPTPAEKKPTVSPSEKTKPTAVPRVSTTTATHSTKKTKTPKTGDETPIALFTALAAAAALGTACIIRRKRHGED